MSETKDFFCAPFRFRNLLFLQASRQLKKKTNGRMLSYFWLMLEPLVIALMMSLVFPLIFESRTNEYAIYLLSGLLAWNFIGASLQKGGHSIKGKLRALLKVNVPVYVYIAASVIELACYMLLACLVLIPLAWLSGVGGVNVAYFSYACVLMLLCSYAVMYVIGVLCVYIPDIQNVISLLVRGLFFLTPIIYPVSRIPEQYQRYMEFNPVHQFIRLFRYSFYHDHNPQIYELAIPLAITLSVVIMAVCFTSIFKKSYMSRMCV